LRLIVLLSFLIGITSSNAQTDFRADVLNMINTIRQSPGECNNIYKRPARQLSWSDLLEQSAMTHAREMKQYDYLDHYSIDGKDIGDRIDVTGYEWRLVGENLAFGQRNLKTVFSDWLESPEHCRLLYHPHMKELGMARVGEYWVLHLGRQ